MKSRFLFGVVVSVVLFLSSGALAQDDAKALVQRGQSKMGQGGAAASKGDFVKANELIQSAMADMDQAVSLAPNDLEVRLARGFSYAAFPPYLNKAAIARDDLEVATHNATFRSLPADDRSHAFQSLGIAYVSLADQDKAVTAFKSAVDAAPDSRFGKDAQVRLTTLETSGLHPDRFPGIPEQISPIIVAVSITYAPTFAKVVQPRIEEIGRSLETFPGFVGRHTVTSMDKPGMFVIFSWWKDKKAASDFYYSDLHQSWMSGRGQAMTGVAPTPSPDAVPTQVAVEIFGSFPGGTRINGSFAPPAPPANSK